MSNNFYSEYYDPLEQVIKREQGYSDVMADSPVHESMLLKQSEMRLLNESATPEKVEGPKSIGKLDFNQLEKLFGKNPHSLPQISIGPHPDFKAIVDHNSTLNHHCVSVFADIKGSTNLVNKYDLKEIRFIKDTILSFCIHLAHFFGGHIHRLQGDGVFLQFVRRGKHPNDAIINALNSSSLMVNFMQSILSDAFESQGIDPLKIRIGIDYGKDEDVLWSHYGIPGCSELTTTSLHTDLAAKLQGKAPSNGIMLGNNIVESLDLVDEFWNYIKKPGSDEKDRYVFRGNGLNYNQYLFDWEKYLQTFDFIEKDYSNNVLNIEIPVYRLRCKISEDESYSCVYNQNLWSIPKEYNIKYELYNEKHDRPVNIHEFKRIKWEAHNTGTEAANEKALKHDFGKKYDGKIYCITGSKYLGHHKAVCKLSRGKFSENKTVSFPIFIQ